MKTFRYLLYTALHILWHVILQGDPKYALPTSGVATLRRMILAPPLKLSDFHFFYRKKPDPMWIQLTIETRACTGVFESIRLVENTVSDAAC